SDPDGSGPSARALWWPEIARPDAGRLHDPQMAACRSDVINIDLRAWEAAVLVHLRERLRAGDIWG
ncbi:hypothetical protein, partial [Mesorhizobium sp.]|uniref:hypothetical protein n=1 Tax=Mesorhizobium sp. TaxID=1871066 RepID=UPI0025B97B06